MEIIITKEDIIEGASYTDIRKCPLINAVKRSLKRENLVAGVEVIGISGGPDIGTVHPGFQYDDYVNLKTGKIKEFRTVFTPIK